MTRPTPIPHDDPQPAGGGGEVLREQRDANEQLVLSSLRAHEAADTARDAQENAELAVGKLRASEAELIAVAEFRERLMGIIGHDLRGPLNAMLLASGVVLSRGVLGEADTRLVRLVVDSGQRMARMISQLVEFTRGRLGGGFELALSDVALGTLCYAIAEELRIGSPVEIRFTRAGDLTGRWDGDRLGEVLSNVAANAVEHATPGTPVLIDVREEQGDVVVEITNEGKCISAETLPFIFTAFRRAGDADSSPPRSGGHLGLGLYIAHELVTAHAGTLDVRSTDGSTTFTTRLPRAVNPAA